MDISLFSNHPRFGGSKSFSPSKLNSFEPLFSIEYDFCLFPQKGFWYSNLFDLVLLGFSNGVNVVFKNVVEYKQFQERMHNFKRSYL